MKISYILTAIAVALILFGGYSCHSKKQAKKAIVYVLEQDKLASKGASTIAEYVRNQKAISLFKCPSDFTLAYRRHQAAWENMEAVEEEAQYYIKRYDSGSAYVEAFLRGMLLDFSMVSDADEAQKRVRNHYKTANKAIRDTFFEVLNIADNYGVDTSAYR